VRDNMLRMECKLRAEVKGNTLYGHAAVFNQRAYIPQERTHEELSDTAFDDVLANPSTDARALMNHDPTLLLGRQSSKTLRLTTDTEGLEFEVDLPDTALGRDVRVLLERGDLDGASFGWLPGKVDRVAIPGGTLQRHTSISRLLDVSVVTFPAYAGAGARLRHESIGTGNRSRLIRARHAVRFIKEGSGS